MNSPAEALNIGLLEGLKDRAGTAIGIGIFFGVQLVTTGASLVAVGSPVRGVGKRAGL